MTAVPDLLDAPPRNRSATAARLPNGYRCHNPDCQASLTGQQRKWCRPQCRDAVRDQDPTRLEQKHSRMASYHKRDDVKARQKTHMANYNAKPNGLICMNPNCDEPLTGIKRKWCSKSCKDKNHDQKPERKKQKAVASEKHKRQHQTRDAAPAPKGIDIDRLRSVVERAHTDAQAADWIGKTPQHLRRLCKKHGIVPPSQRKKKQMAELRETLDLENQAKQRLGLQTRNHPPTITRRCTAGCGRAVENPGPCAHCQKETAHV